MTTFREVKSLPLREGQLGAEGGETGGEAAAQPGHDARAGDHVLAHRGGAEAVDDEHRKGHRHEGAAQFQHARQHMDFVGGDKLRQEGEEEDRQFRIEDVDEKAGDDDPAEIGRASCRERV